eukprot:CAMPEP_0170472084 /NCGR_PEP_ID=MMETSP0123-20130129/14182_1 /TAXON_ID=182087 /ORGANISM="Favella ehrenbergii, Strain Fehren 1" /LENGTH=57 /DNA_ID=CAMNT_0010740135 /DNA_START=252 /DNA_END=425 /DNA_ORIENTATION=+
MEKAPDTAKKDSTGRNALHYASRAGNHKTTRILLNAMTATEREQATNGGITPLMAAV